MKTLTYFTRTLTFETTLTIDDNFSVSLATSLDSHNLAGVIAHSPALRAEQQVNYASRENRLRLRSRRNLQFQFGFPRSLGFQSPAHGRFQIFDVTLVHIIRGAFVVHLGHDSLVVRAADKNKRQIRVSRADDFQGLEST